MTGRAMQRHLEGLGLAPQKVVRKRETGDYVADFYVPEMDAEIEPARIWARRILALLPDAVIVNTHDTIASWRPGNPVIYASVIFRLQEEEAA